MQKNIMLNFIEKGLTTYICKTFNVFNVLQFDVSEVTSTYIEITFRKKFGNDYIIADKIHKHLQEKFKLTAEIIYGETSILIEYKVADIQLIYTLLKLDGY